jgi:hypothetical protein
MCRSDFIHIFVRSFTIIKKKKTKNDAMRTEEEMKKKKKYMFYFFCLPMFDVYLSEEHNRSLKNIRTKRTFERERGRELYPMYILSLVADAVVSQDMEAEQKKIS